MNAENIIRALRQGGYRITAVRRAVIELCAEHKKPLGALDVQKLLLKKKVQANPTTVYRELQFLADQHILQTVHFRDGVQRYELASLPHHHHLVCESCNKVEDVHMDHDLAKIEKSIAKKNRFTISAHSLEFYGRCKTCQ